MQAIILAAGLGRRLGTYTKDNTKCMVKVNGIRLIDRLISQLNRLNLNRIIIVTGYKGTGLRNHIERLNSQIPIEFINNDVYDKTNNIYSLSLTRNHLKNDDTLLIESDLIVDDTVFNLILDSPHPNVALVDKYQTWMDGTMVRIEEDHNIVNFIPKKAFKYSDTQFYYKTVNIYKFSKEFSKHHYLPFLDAYLKVLGNNEYYEQVLRVITLIDNCNIKALPLTGQKWYEIDDVQDLRIAETIFAKGSERLKRIQEGYGGYWRYPFLIDFCYLVNPYFPKKKMVEEMSANFETLLRNYPSGMGVNSMLASKYFGISQDYVCVGNGAAELIKSLMSKLSGKIGCIFPTFEEYPNRKLEDIISYEPTNDDFKYTVQDLISFFSEHIIDNLILINPDNPSGNFVPVKDVLRLYNWCKDNKIRLIVDESFVDFTDDFENNSLLKDDIIESHSELVVVKSISKSYGVPGLRLGILASGDKELITIIKKDVAIWNINSFAEFYMQIFNKYEKDYKQSCEKFINERNRFYVELSGVRNLRVVTSQANYFLCEVTKMKAKTLTERLLTEFNILIKDCTSKKGFHDRGEYIRIAIRDKKDNDQIVASLKNILE